MESNLHEDSSKTSSYEEDEEQETDNRRSSDKEMGTGRSYECVFCKRGFTTAQALGGHMNIHRKDRAKPRPNLISSSSKMDDYDHDYNHYANIRGISSYPHHYSSTVHHHHEMLINYQTFIPAASTSTSKNTRWGFGSPHAQYSDDLYVQSPQLLNHFQADWRSNLSLQIGPSHVDLDDDDDDNKEKTQDDQLDLELRLGHDP